MHTLQKLSLTSLGVLAAALAFTACERSNTRDDEVVTVEPIGTDRPAPADDPMATDDMRQTTTGMQAETITVTLHPTIASACNVVAGAAFFRFDSATLSWSDERVADQVATCLKTGPLAGEQIRLVGRADPRGSAQYNRRLGQARAEAVANALQRDGLARDRMKVVSRGEQGFAGGGSKLAHALQRRVDIQLVDPKPVDVSMTYWDYDGDGAIGQDEFYTYMSGMNDYDAWDRDRSGALDMNETRDAMRTTWDTDRDRRLNRDEFEAGMGGWYRDDARYGDFDTWDADGDDFLDDDEWNAGFARHGMYNAWDLDGDGMLYEPELSTGLYGYWDADADGVLADDELTDYRNLYWSGL